MQTTTEIQGSAAPAGTAAKVNKGALRSPLVIALGGLLVLQLFLAAFLPGSWGKKMGPAESAGPLLAFDPEQVTGIRIQSPAGEPVRVTRTEDGWIIPALQNLPAAKHKVTALLSKLEDLQRGLPVATSEAALKRFKVVDQIFERKLILERGAALPVILYLGDSPGFRRLFVRADGDGAVYEAELGLFDAPDRPDAWSDRTLLHLDPGAIRRLTFAGLTLERTDNDWRLTDLAEGEDQDEQAVKDRIRVLTNIDFLGVLGDEERPAIDTESTPIELEATLADGETIRYRITKFMEGNDHLLEASNRPQGFTLAGYVAEDLTDLQRTDLLKKPGENKETGEDASAGSSPAQTADEGDADPVATSGTP